MKKSSLQSLFVLALILPGLVWADPGQTAAPATATQTQAAATDQPERLPIWNIVTDIPETAWLGLKMSFSKDAIPAWAVILGSTAILYHYDPDLLSGAQATGRDWGLGNDVKYKSVINLGSTSLWSAPVDTAGWLYFMGDGTIPIVMSVGFIGGGYLGSNNRLYNTGIEMADGLLTGSIFDQVIKHIAGRQSPSQATSPRGDFHPFPNLKAYAANTSAYDAMASGHIMTATVMFTVIEQEYPEFNTWMYPLEVAWLGVLGFGMMNVGVHWASDYPLGIGMGYVFAKAAVDLHKPKKDGSVAQWRFFPGVDPASGTSTINALYYF